jgi:hypothetical protein
MMTAIQLRPLAKHNGPRCDLVHGSGRELAAGEHRLALFDAGEPVVNKKRLARLCVFRTLSIGDALGARIPGVRSIVRLLLDARSIGGARIGEGLFACLTKTGRDNLNAGPIPSGHRRLQKVLPSLLDEQAIARTVRWLQAIDATGAESPHRTRNHGRLNTAVKISGGAR